jgi:hypothetical protein
MCITMQTPPTDQGYGAEIHDGLGALFEVSAYLQFPFTLEEAASYFLPRSNITAAQLRSLLSGEGYADLNFVVKDGYLFTSHDQSISSRFEREQISAAKLDSAATFANLLTRLVPFIRIIAVTGSVAYGSAGKWDDIDLFVVTERKRLWLSNLLMLVQVRISKILGVRSPHLLNFCLSYAHDQDGFSNESRKNRNALFARELLKAKPVAGINEYRKMLEANRWVSELYPTSYQQKLGLLGQASDEAEPLPTMSSKLRSFFLDWVEGIAYVTLSRYLRLRAYLTNLKLKSEGKNLRTFEPIISSTSCIYTSTFYRWLRSLWGK